MKAWQKRITSPSERPLGSKSAPPLPPPMAIPVSAFLKICSKPRNFTIERFTVGWKRRPPLYGPRALLKPTLKPRFTRTRPASSCQATRKIAWRSGSTSRSSRAPSAYSGRRARKGPRLWSTSNTDWWNSGSPGLRRSTSR